MSATLSQRTRASHYLTSPPAHFPHHHHPPPFLLDFFSSFFNSFQHHYHHHLLLHLHQRVFTSFAVLLRKLFRLLLGWVAELLSPPPPPLPFTLLPFTTLAISQSASSARTKLATCRGDKDQCRLATEERRDAVCNRHCFLFLIPITSMLLFKPEFR